MNPLIWGPSFWFVIHTICLHYPHKPSEEDKNRHQQFLLLLRFLLPCEKCRRHYSEYIQENPPQLYSKDDLVSWSVRLHNHVNSLNHKAPMTMQQMIQLYKSTFQSSASTYFCKDSATSSSSYSFPQITSKMTLITILVIIAMIAIFLVWSS